MEAEPHADRRPLSLVRTFLAVDLDGAFLDDVAALQDRLRAAEPFSKAGAPRWVARAAMHVTLRFFGSVDEAGVESLRSLVGDLAALAARAGPGTVSVLARSLIGFPDARRARVLALELESGGLLESFGARAESAAVALGFDAEARVYRPHLTLARLKRPADVTTFAGEAASLRAARITAIALYASKTAASGPIYTPLERAELS